jgi:hypothetical protein
MPAESVIFSEIRQECEDLIKQVCNKIFRGKDYHQTNVATWISQANDELIKQLRERNRNFKYLIEMMVLQKKISDTGENQPNVVEMAAECWWNQ